MNGDVPSLENHEDTLIEHDKRILMLERKVFNMQLTIQGLIEKLSSLRLIGVPVDSWESPE
jgi:hypothetical protein